MAQKKITDLQLIDAVVAGLSVPSDDGIQSYRFTAAQMKAYILANENILLAMLKNDIFNGLTSVSAADDDYFTLVDTSDSNKTKKALVGTFVRAVYRSVTTTDSVGVSDSTMKLSGSSFTSTLPTAVGVAGKRYKFIHAGTSFSQVYTIATTSSQTIGGVAGGSYLLNTNGEVLEVESDGSNWIICGRITDTGWISYTPSSSQNGWGTVTVNHARWRRRGDSMDLNVHFSFTSQTGANEARFELPGGTTASWLQTSTIVGGAGKSPSSVNDLCLLAQPSKSYVNFGMSRDAASNGNIVAANLTSISMSNGSSVGFYANGIPMTNWQP